MIQSSVPAIIHTNPSWVPKRRLLVCLGVGCRFWRKWIDATGNILPHRLDGYRGSNSSLLKTNCMSLDQRGISIDSKECISVGGGVSGGLCKAHEKFVQIGKIPDLSEFAL